ncbi:hypothetical protein IJ541_03755 [bacterium]|nr:hypothetical protein [bacterium]
MKKYLLICITLICIPSIVFGMTFQEWNKSKKEGYIMSDWINKHDRLDSNMSLNAGYDKNLNRLYVELKTKNNYGQIPNVNNQKVSYQIDKFAVSCMKQTFGIIDTKVYNENNQLITTLNNRSRILAMTYIDTAKTNEQKIGKILTDYACSSPYNTFMYNWLKTHNKLSPNMTMTPGYNTTYGIFVDVKTTNQNNLIKNYNGQKVAYQTDKFCINCKSKQVTLSETKLYNKSNSEIATFNQAFHVISYEGNVSNENKNLAILAKYFANIACPKYYQQYLKDYSLPGSKQ